MPKLWDQTVDAHRRAVRETILDAAGELVSEHGLRALTMSQVAERADIGRATLYKYFADVEALLFAWHERHVATHVARLAEVRDRIGPPGERLRAVLGAYALIAHEQHSSDLAALLHRGDHVAQAQQHLHALVRDLLAEAAADGELRDDVAPEEMAAYCLHALTAAGTLPSKAAVHRLVDLTLSGLRPSA
ncbi:TetR family transcriptional regulator [Streptomyces sp. GD-15H]|uniref:TetR/AcrR family transcriptional regulator n=1 Tax=Streptomyces sp. GD-15H TaxID=3129112 RepID=UPI003256342A